MTREPSKRWNPVPWLREMQAALDPNEDLRPGMAADEIERLRTNRQQQGRPEAMGYDVETYRRRSCYFEAHSIICQSLNSTDCAADEVGLEFLGDLEQKLASALIDAGADYRAKHNAQLDLPETT